MFYIKNLIYFLLLLTIITNNVFAQSVSPKGDTDGSTGEVSGNVSPKGDTDNTKVKPKGDTGASSSPKGDTGGTTSPKGDTGGNVSPKGDTDGPKPTPSLPILRNPLAGLGVKGVGQ